MYTMSFKFNGLEKTEAQINTLVLDTERRLKEKMLAKSGFREERSAMAEMVTLFRRYDAHKTGEMGLKQFIRVLEENSLCGMDDVLTELFHRYDTDDSGCIDYAEFTKGLYGVVPVPAAHEECRSLCRRICSQLVQGSKAGDSRNRALILSLRSMDQDGNGILTTGELEGGFARHGIFLSPEEWNVISKYFDRNKDGMISIEEVCHTIRGDLTEWRTRLVKLAFSHVDADESGEISFEELKDSYRSDLHPAVLAGVASEDEALSSFIESWVKAAGESISEMEFVDYYKDVSNAIGSDEDFLLLLKQTWRTRPGREKQTPQSKQVQVEVTRLDGSKDVVPFLCCSLPAGRRLTNQNVELELRKAGHTDVSKVKIQG